MANRIDIRVTDEEHKTIKENASEAHMNVSEFLREVGHKLIPQSKLDYETIKILLEKMVELKRLGNLQKKALNDPRYWREVGPEIITATQKEIHETLVELKAFTRKQNQK